MTYGSTCVLPGNTVAPAVAAPALAPAAPAAALPVDSTLLQEMVSRAVREALQSGAAGALNTDAIAASLSAAPLPQPAPQPEPEPEPEPEPKPERRARKHRVFTIPASVSYKPTPLRDLERRRSTAEPRFSDDEDDGPDETPTSAATLAAGAAEQTAKESETSSKTAQAAETAPTPATTAEESTSKESEEFDLLEQIMAESSKPIQMTSTLRRRLRARPVVFRAAATRADGDETYEPAGAEQARALQEKAAKEAEKSSTEVVGKKRVAHTAGLDQPSRPAPRVAPKVTPAQAMHARWQKLAEMQQQRIAQLEEQQRQREAENSRLPPLLPQPPVPSEYPPVAIAFSSAPCRQAPL
ncbi:hypothetical protein FJT64_008368 [Amphibalanus amphitrite]|uniref:Uncharacterized protein n=1 Tax=Amphibalanus amphitrite TaxID=1232801 RepID=A0A6A4VWY1_AMPAM|nr:hypothetical protein FJT64_008368 [Amphibalanus amphitrite]